MSCIPCLAWAKRGATVGQLQKVKLCQEELADLVSQKTPSDEGSDAGDSDCDGNDIEKKYGLSNYDADEDLEAKGLALKGLVLPHCSIKDNYLIEDDEESEDAEIQPDDNILAIGRVKNDLYTLEAYVYNEATSSLFCHHDTILESFPLAMEWVGYDPGEDSPGNLLAVSSTEPHIDIWDLDIVNTLEPSFVLGKPQKGKSHSNTRKGHTDAVLALSWNTLQKNALASGSADCTIGLWDLEEMEMVTSIEHHSEKVQALQWHPFEKELLLSGSFDKTARVFDCRDCSASHRSWSLCGEVEKVVWDARYPYYFLAGTDDGYMYYFDVRSEQPVFSVKAHKRAISGMSFSSELPGCVVTSSTDQLIKIWDIRDNKPRPVCRINRGIGELHSLAPCPDSGFIFAIGAETDLQVFHLKTSNKVLDRWNLEAMPGKQKNKLKLRESDEESSESDEESSEEDVAEHSSGESSEDGSVEQSAVGKIKKSKVKQSRNRKKLMNGDKSIEDKQEHKGDRKKKKKTLVNKDSATTDKSLNERKKKKGAKQESDTNENISIKRSKTKKKVSSTSEAIAESCKTVHSDTNQILKKKKKQDPEVEDEVGDPSFGSQHHKKKKKRKKSLDKESDEDESKETNHQVHKTTKKKKKRSMEAVVSAADVSDSDSHHSGLCVSGTKTSSVSDLDSLADTSHQKVKLKKKLKKSKSKHKNVTK